MDNEGLRQLWNVCIWYFGISATVTLALFAWIARLHDKIYQLKDQYMSEGNLRVDVKALLDDMKEIKGALLGTFKEKGLITKHYDLEQRLEELEKGR